MKINPDQKNLAWGKRFIALFLILCLNLSQSLSFAGAISMQEGMLKVFQNPLIPIPSEIGKIDEFFTGSQGKTILYIQDAHDSLEAQENIAKLIGYLVAHYGVKTVFEEGYEGTVPTDRYFSWIRDPEIREKVSYFLLDKLRLGGAEYAHINRKKDFRLIGADSLKLHQANVESYQRSAELTEEVKTDLDAIRKRLEILAAQRFSPEFKTWLKEKKRFEAEQLSLVDYLRRMARLSSLEPLASKSYPLIQLLLREGNSKDPLVIEKFQAMKPQAIFQELETLEKGILQKFLTTSEDRKLFESLEALELLSRLQEIKVTTSEYQKAQATLRNFKTEDLAKFLAQKTHQPILLSKRWEQNIRAAVEFYRLAEERDKNVEVYLDAFVKNSDEKLAVLVFGGFHKRAVLETLRRKGISCQAILPYFSALSPRHQAYYQKLMTTGRHEFEVPELVAQASRTISFLRQLDFAPVAAKSELRRLVDLTTEFRALERPLLLREVEKGLARIELPLSRAETRTARDVGRAGDEKKNKVGRPGEYDRGELILEFKALAESLPPGVPKTAGNMAKASGGKWITQGILDRLRNNKIARREVGMVVGLKGRPLTEATKFWKISEDVLARVNETIDFLKYKAKVRGLSVQKTPQGIYASSDPTLTIPLIQFLKIPSRREFVIVDAGSGQGDFLLRLALLNRNLRAIGIESDGTLFDESRKVLKLAQERWPGLLGRLNFRHGDMTAPEFFPVIQRANLIYYYGYGTREEEKLVETLTRGMKPGAQLVVTENHDRIHRYLTRSDAFDFIASSDDRIRVYTRRSEVRADLTNSGARYRRESDRQGTWHQDQRAEVRSDEVPTHEILEWNRRAEHLRQVAQASWHRNDYGIDRLIKKITEGQTPQESKLLLKTLDALYGDQDADAVFYQDQPHLQLLIAAARKRAQKAAAPRMSRRSFLELIGLATGVAASGGVGIWQAAIDSNLKTLSGLEKFMPLLHRAWQRWTLNDFPTYLAPSFKVSQDTVSRLVELTVHDRLSPDVIRSYEAWARKHAPRLVKTIQGHQQSFYDLNDVMDPGSVPDPEWIEDSIVNNLSSNVWRFGYSGQPVLDMNEVRGAINVYYEDLAQMFRLLPEEIREQMLQSYRYDRRFGEERSVESKPTPVKQFKKSLLDEFKRGSERLRRLDRIEANLWSAEDPWISASDRAFYEGHKDQREIWQKNLIRISEVLVRLDHLGASLPLPVREAGHQNIVGRSEVRTNPTLPHRTASGTDQTVSAGNDAALHREQVQNFWRRFWRLKDLADRFEEDLMLEPPLVTQRLFYLIREFKAIERVFEECLAYRLEHDPSGALQLQSQEEKLSDLEDAITHIFYEQMVKNCFGAGLVGFIVVAGYLNWISNHATMMESLNQAVPYAAVIALGYATLISVRKSFADRYSMQGSAGSNRDQVIQKTSVAPVSNPSQSFQVRQPTEETKVAWQPFSAEVVQEIMTWVDDNGRYFRVTPEQGDWMGRYVQGEIDAVAAFQKINALAKERSISEMMLIKVLTVLAIFNAYQSVIQLSSRKLFLEGALLLFGHESNRPEAMRYLQEALVEVVGDEADKATLSFEIEKKLYRLRDRYLKEIGEAENKNRSELRGRVDLEYPIQPLSEALLKQLPGMTLGQRVEAIIEARGMKVFEFRKKTGISEGTFYLIWRDKAKNPAPKNLQTIARLLNVEVLLLLEGLPEKEALRDLSWNRLLRNFRQKQGWLQKEMAEELIRTGEGYFKKITPKTAETYVYLWEEGKREPPFDARPVIAKILGVEEESLFHDLSFSLYGQGGSLKPQSEEVRKKMVSYDFDGKGIKAGDEMPAIVVPGEEKTFRFEDRQAAYSFVLLKFDKRFASEKSLEVVFRGEQHPDLGFLLAVYLASDVDRANPLKWFQYDKTAKGAVEVNPSRAAVFDVYEGRGQDLKGVGQTVRTQVTKAQLGKGVCSVTYRGGRINFLIAAREMDPAWIGKPVVVRVEKDSKTGRRMNRLYLLSEFEESRRSKGLLLPIASYDERKKLPDVRYEALLKKLSKTKTQNGIGERLEILRHYRGIPTAAELYGRAGVSPAVYSNIVSGRNELPQPKTIQTLAEALRVEPLLLLIGWTFEETIQEIPLPHLMVLLRMRQGWDQQAFAGELKGTGHVSFQDKTVNALRQELIQWETGKAMPSKEIRPLISKMLDYHDLFDKENDEEKKRKLEAALKEKNELTEQKRKALDAARALKLAEREAAQALKLEEREAARARKAEEKKQKEEERLRVLETKRAEAEKLSAERALKLEEKRQALEKKKAEEKILSLEEALEVERQKELRRASKVKKARLVLLKQMGTGDKAKNGKLADSAGKQPVKTGNADLPKPVVSVPEVPTSVPSQTPLNPAPVSNVLVEVSEADRMKEETEKTILQMESLSTFSKNMFAAVAEHAKNFSRQRGGGVDEWRILGYQVLPKLMRQAQGSVGYVFGALPEAMIKARNGNGSNGNGNGNGHARSELRRPTQADLDSRRVTRVSSELVREKSSGTADRMASFIPTSSFSTLSSRVSTRNRQSERPRTSSATTERLRSNRSTSVPTSVDENDFSGSIIASQRVISNRGGSLATKAEDVNINFSDFKYAEKATHGILERLGMVEQKRILIDFNDLKASFSDEQIKEIAFVAENAGRDTRIVLYNVDRLDSLGKFFIERRSSRFDATAEAFSGMTKRLQGFQGQVIHLSSADNLLAGAKLKEDLSKVGIAAHQVVPFAYLDPKSGTLGQGLLDLQAGKLAEMLTENLSGYGFDSRRRIVINDLSLTQSWQDLYNSSLAFSRAA